MWDSNIAQLITSQGRVILAGRPKPSTCQFYPVHRSCQGYYDNVIHSVILSASPFQEIPQRKMSTRILWIPRAS